MSVAVVAIVDGQPVSGGRVDFEDGVEFAGLFGGITLPEYRRRGLYRATVAKRAELARERGYRWLYSDALPTSRPILERLGFVAADDDDAVRHSCAQLAELLPARVEALLHVLVRLGVEVLAADRAEPGAVGAAEDLIGQRERDCVASPGGEVQPVVLEVLRPLVFALGLRRLVLA